jgi:hypothetical protein
MAHLIPPDVQRQSLSGHRSGELETLLRLEKQLPDDYTIYHHVHWSLERPRFTIYGEIDFIVVNRAGRALAIEQKDGALVEGQDGLVKHYNDGDKSVVRQIHRSLDGLRDKFQQAHGRSAKLDLDYLLLCPDHRLLRSAAAGLDPSRIVDVSRVNQLPAIIQELLGAGAAAGGSDFDRVSRFLDQAFDLVPDVSTYIASQERTFARLTSGLNRVVSGLAFQPFRLRLSAPAGSGKTQVAHDFYTRAAAASKRVAYICFNRPLAMRVLRSVPAGGTVNTYHGFLHRFLESIGEVVNFADASRDRKFWSRIQERVLTADIPETDKFDCLIVDEGQDFEPEWWQILRLFLTDDAAVLWLEDDDQNLYGRRPGELDGFVAYRDQRNFRTPLSIARFIQKTLESDFEPANSLPGLGVVVHTYQQPMDQVALIAHRVNELVRIGFKSDDVVVLSCRGLESATLHDIDAVGSLRLRRFTGDYDAAHNQIYTDGQLLFDTVFRFKGQQAPAIILMDIDQRLSDASRWRPILYCGMTRAMVRLELLVQDGTGLQQRLAL